MAVGRHSAAKLKQEPDVRRRLPWFLREPGPLALIAIVVLVVVCGAWALIDIGRNEGPAGMVTGGGAPTAAYIPTAPLVVPPSDAFPPSGTPSGGTPSPAGTPSPGDGIVGSPAGAPTTSKASGPVPTTAGRPVPTTASRPHPTATPPTPTDRGTKPVTATYSLDVVWTGRFQASVVLHNSTASQQTWTVLLSYGNGVTANVAAWVDGAPSPKVSRTGNSWAFTAGAPLSAGGDQTLRVQFDISDQKAPASVSCAVNGRACAMP